jgi:xanthine dehydrogenase accessory factor
MTPEILAALEQAKRDKRPVVLATQLPSGEQCLLPDTDAPAALNEAAARALDRDESGTVKILDTDYFLHAYNPPLRGCRPYRPGAGPVRRAVRVFGHRGGPAPVLRIG